MDSTNEQQGIDKLIEDYNRGSLSRRDLMRALLALSVVPAIAGCPPGDGGSDDNTTTGEDPDTEDPVAASDCDGRKVLLERIINQKFVYVDPQNPDPLERRKIALTGEKIFPSSFAHQNWLFGPNGLQDYGQQNANFHAIQDDIAESADAVGQDGCTIQDASVRNGIVGAKNQCDGPLDVFRRGVVPSDDVYDDLYGLVKAMLDAVCANTFESTLATVLQIVRDADENAVEVRRMFERDSFWTTFGGEIERTADWASVDINHVKASVNEHQPGLPPDAIPKPSFHGGY